MELTPILDSLTEFAGRQAPDSEAAQALRESESAAKERETRQPESLERQDRLESVADQADPGVYGLHGQNAPANLPSRQPASGIGLLMGRISLDLSYSRSTVSTSGNQYSASIHEERLSLDFSFIQAVIGEGARDVGSGYQEFLNSGVLDDFVTATMKLNFAEDSTLEEYNRSVDALFNKLEETLGLGSEDLDYVQDSFKNSVAGFFDRVQADLEQEGITLPALGGELPVRVAEAGRALDDLRGNLLRETGRLLEQLGDTDHAGRLRNFADNLPNEDNLVHALRDFIQRFREQTELAKDNPSPQAGLRQSELPAAATQV